MQNPQVTVLMPVYNGEKFLATAIRSILEQTFDDFEFLIIDDASFDKTAEIVHSFGDSRIRYYRNDQNLGITPSLNKGISLAKGALIARMDADDVSYPARLEKQVQFFRDNPECALLSSWTRVVDENGHELRTERYRSRYYYYNLCFECWIYHSSIMCRKDALEAVGGYVIPFAEDFQLFWQISRQFKIWNLPEVLLDYRITSDSLHQVIRKDEYSTEMSILVKRNISYYAGSDLHLNNDELDCLRNNFDPLLKKNSVYAVINCLKKLERIDQGILKNDNPNLDKIVVLEAARNKRRFIIEFYARNFSKWKGLLLLIKLREWRFLQQLVGEHFDRVIHNRTSGANVFQH